ncbi:MAG: radical SAM protein [Planctomycetes bacterium]|nr:radical SAM protein [Planctomycetota bacterium]
MPKCSSRFVNLEICYNCNNKCISCPSPPAWKKHGILPFNEVKSYIDKYRENTLTLSGGEPTIHPDFLEITRYAAKTGTWLGILTNGRKFADKKFAKEAIKSGLREPFIVFHSSDRKLFDAFTGVKGSFDETLAGIKNLMELRGKGNKLLINVKILACKSTIKSLSETVRFISEELPRPNMLLMESLDMVSGALSNRKKTFIRLTDAKPYIMKALDIGSSYNQNIKLYRIPPCIFPNPGFYLPFVYREPKIGEMVGPPRTEIDICAIPEETRSPCVKPESCKECEADNLCRGVWRSYERFFGLDELKPIKYRKLPSWLRRS